MNEDKNLYLMLGRLEGKLDASLSGITRVEQRQNQFEQRLNKLESLKDAASGTLAGVFTTSRIVWVAGSALLAFLISNMDRIIQ